MKQYSFAQNGRKLQRAIMEVGKEELAEEQKYSRVKELYVSYGGSLINEAPQEEPTKEEVVAMVNNSASQLFDEIGIA